MFKNSQDEALYQAIKWYKLPEIIQALDKGANPNSKCPDTGETALLHLTRKGWQDQDGNKAFELLLKHGADVSASNKDGMTALHLLVTDRGFKGREYFDILVAAGADINKADQRGNTPFHKAVEDSVSSNNLYYVKKLLSLGASTHAVNNEGLTPLELGLNSPYIGEKQQKYIKLFEDFKEQINKQAEAEGKEIAEQRRKELKSLSKKFTLPK